LGQLIVFENIIKETGLSIDQYADFIQNASTGLRDTANNEPHLISLLAALKASILSFTGNLDDG
jgi:hypothetical protein